MFKLPVHEFCRITSILVVFWLPWYNTSFFLTWYPWCSSKIDEPNVIRKVIAYLNELGLSEAFDV